LPGAPFTVTGAPAVGDTIAPDQSVTVQVDFAPAQIGQFSNEIDLHTADGEQVDVGVAGSASTPGLLSFSTQSIDFGAVTVGTTVSRTFTLTNTGGSDVTIEKSKPPFAGAITAALGSLPEGATIAPGQTLTETVFFAPAATGPAGTSWAITGDDGSGLHQVQFSGTGARSGEGAGTGSGSGSGAGSGAPPGSGSGTGPATAPPARGAAPATSLPAPRAPRLAPNPVTTAAVGRATITYTALVAATSRFTIQRELSGRRSGRRCVAPTTRNRGARSCTRLVTVAVSGHRDRVGATRLPLSALIAIRKLTPGTYRVQSVLDDARGVRHVFVAVLRVRPAGRQRG
jgi:hypothetical protein